jgi:hypothetical protein
MRTPNRQARTMRKPPTNSDQPAFKKRHLYLVANDDVPTVERDAREDADVVGNAADAAAAEMPARRGEDDSATRHLSQNRPQLRLV